METRLCEVTYGFVFGIRPGTTNGYLWLCLRYQARDKESQERSMSMSMKLGMKRTVVRNFKLGHNVDWTVIPTTYEQVPPSKFADYLTGCIGSNSPFDYLIPHHMDEAEQYHQQVLEVSHERRRLISSFQRT